MRPEPLRPPPPPGCGSAFQGPPLVGGRVRPLPPLQSAEGGVPIQAPQVPRERGKRVLGSSPPQMGDQHGLPAKSPSGRGLFKRPKFSGRPPPPRFPAPFQKAELFQEGCTSVLPLLTGPESIPALEVPSGAPRALQARGQGRPGPVWLGGGRAAGPKDWGCPSRELEKTPPGSWEGDRELQWGGSLGRWCVVGKRSAGPGAGGDGALELGGGAEQGGSWGGGRAELGSGGRIARQGTGESRAQT